MKRGLRLNREQQIAHVRRYGESSQLQWLAAACIGVAVLGIVAFSLFEREVLEVIALVVGGMSGLVGLAILAHLPALRRIARATRTGRRVQGVLQLQVDASDSESIVYTGQMQEGGATWVLGFGNPMGWEPQAGDWPCELVFLSDQPVPALAMLEQGLLFPTATSRKTYTRTKAVAG